MGISNTISTRHEHLITTFKICLAMGLLSTSGMIRYDITGVPFTMQTMAVMLIALYDTKKTALTSVIAYSGLCAVWSLTTAPFYTLSLTFGYILGFIPATAWIHYAMKNGHNDSIVGRLRTLMTAQGIIWLVGYCWLAKFTGYLAAFHIGILPFILTDALKVVMVLLCSGFVSTSQVKLS